METVYKLLNIIPCVYVKAQIINTRHNGNEKRKHSLHIFDEFFQKEVSILSL